MKNASYKIVATFTIYVHSKFSVTNSNASLSTVIKQNAACAFAQVAMLFNAL